MPGAFVFPGGAVDPGDADPATLALLHGADGGAPRPVVIAALRELLEEAGILFACDPSGSRAIVSPTVAGALRARLAARDSLGTLLAEHGLALDATPLVHYSNWITPATQTIRFDTHFFLARAPADQVPSADAVEVHDGTWFAPGDALARAQRNELSIVFPTRKHLERLARFETVEPLLAHARQCCVSRVVPIEGAGGEIALQGEADEW